MSVYGELDPMVEHKTQFAFKGKREHIAKVNMPNIEYPGQHIDIEIPTTWHKRSCDCTGYRQNYV